MLKDDVPSDDLPRVPGDNDETNGTEDHKHLATKLIGMRHEKILQKAKESATGHEKHYILKATLSHAGDFLSGSIRDHACRMFTQFEPVVRYYLGIPVTPDRCFIDKCNGVSVHPFGAHGHHCKALIVHRHDDTRDVIVAFARSAVRQHLWRSTVFREHWLRECGLPPKKSDLGARADVVIFDEARRFHHFLDVTIVHPTPGDGTALPDVDLRKAHEGKLRKYKENHDVNVALIVPLAFETTGGRLPETDDFLQCLVRSIAGGDDKLRNKLWNMLNYRLAAAVAKGEGNILNA
jgi:hypothetical protein